MQELLISYITSDPGYAIIIAIVLSIFIFWTKQEWNISGNPRDGAFEDNLIVLKGRGFSDKYFKLLVVFLQTFDKLYSKPEKGNRPNLVRIVSLHYFTAHSFERCLLIAFSYTQLLVLLQWVLIGSSSFGAYEILNTNIDLQYRLIYAACLFFLMLMCYWSTKAFHQNNSKWPTLLLFCIYFVFSNSETADAISNVDFSFAFLGIGAALYLGAFSAAAVFIGISLGLIGVYFYFFYIVEYIFLSDHLNELFESEDPYILFGITLPITLFGTFLCVLFFKYSYRTAVIPFRYLQSKFTENRFYLVAWVFLVIFTVYFVHIFLLSVLGAPGSDEEVSTWVVTVFYVLLLGCLPLGNAVFDWVSVNITRALLKKIEVNFQSDNMMGFFALFGWIIFDLIAALILLMGVLFFYSPTCAWRECVIGHFFWARINRYKKC